MDLNDVEQTDFNALGGVDRVTVGDLSGTDMTEVNTNLAGSPAASTTPRPTPCSSHGTNGDDVAIVAGDAGRRAALGLAAQVNVTGAAAGSDRLSITMLGGRRRGRRLRAAGQRRPAHPSTAAIRTT